MSNTRSFHSITIFALATCFTSVASAQLLPFGAFNRSATKHVGGNANQIEEVPAIPAGPVRPHSRDVLRAPQSINQLPSPTYEEAGSYANGVDQGSDGVELVTERYEDGKVKIQRSVRQDAQRNYVNHGQWSAYNRAGKVLAQGEFYNGKLHGKWMRFMSHLGVDSEFKAPFMSQAEFNEGELEGAWTIFDSAQRLVASWEFKNGKLHGKTAAWYASGQQKSAMTFVDGEPDGEAMVYNKQGRVIRKDFYREGKQLVPVVNRFDKKRKETEGWLLRTNFVFKTNFDWWNGVAEVQKETTSGEDKKIGKWVQWHPNGQLRYVGNFKDGEPTGKHTWWHENGQRELVGEYESGLREGLWTRWYGTGQKHEEGTYLAGTKYGEWTTWDERGQIAKVKTARPGSERSVNVPRPLPTQQQVSFPRVSK